MGTSGDNITDLLARVRDGDDEAIQLLWIELGRLALSVAKRVSYVQYDTDEWVSDIKVCFVETARRYVRLPEYSREGFMRYVSLAIISRARYGFNRKNEYIHAAIRKDLDRLQNGVKTKMPATSLVLAWARCFGTKTTLDIDDIDESQLPYRAIYYDDGAEQGERFVRDLLKLLKQKVSEAQTEHARRVARYAVEYFFGVPVKDVAGHHGVTERVVRYAIRTCRKWLSHMPKQRYTE